MRKKVKQDSCGVVSLLFIHLSSSQEIIKLFLFKKTRLFWEIFALSLLSSPKIVKLQVGFLFLSFPKSKVRIFPSSRGLIHTEKGENRCGEFWRKGHWWFLGEFVSVWLKSVGFWCIVQISFFVFCVFYHRVWKGVCFSSDSRTVFYDGFVVTSI